MTTKENLKHYMLMIWSYFLMVIFKKFQAIKLHWMGPCKVKIAHDNCSFVLINFESTPLSIHTNGYHLKKLYAIKDIYKDNLRGGGGRLLISIIYQKFRKILKLIFLGKESKLIFKLVFSTK